MISDGIFLVDVAMPREIIWQEPVYMGSTWRTGAIAMTTLIEMINPECQN